jgi:hypothetical protein
MQAAMQEPVLLAVIEAFRGLVSDPEAIHRTLLLRNGFYAGQKFTCDGMTAVLTAATDEVIVVGKQGEVVKKISLIPNNGLGKAA